ncbi:uncharacterized protein C5L36_0C03380 [Pichia kudriavzevii]|uniref:SAP domain-containing protein n=1 Tax=Pichia kudriavzevii TaxID=4909 RepID=A0A2U9R5W6_PICKU|nr:uncharacterized protein C5L36_0C03380 [Pichia kudriavzevii]AWU76398.1 hypothetical protein C5L36_0C03380 [Pichia kudriavzevii]
MTKYATLLKGKLQELLAERGLPTDGTKDVLVERLEESDKIAAELDQDLEEPVANSSQGATTDKNVEDQTVPTTNDATVTDATTTPTAVGDATESLQARAVKLLEGKIARVRRFGDESSAVALQKQLARVVRFGVTPGSALALEVEGPPTVNGDSPLHHGHSHGHGHHHHHHGHGHGPHGRRVGYVRKVRETAKVHK